MDIEDDNDSGAGDTNDDDLFFKRLEQKIHNGDNGDISFLTFEKLIFRLVRAARELLDNVW